ncbi:MAG: hypothetical protein M1828_002322 [Chrysothrix sp. TS-e1954]|nr:MAG: hypothetical protein M1828_002322 [Chrysothrix sp. TS-e1954]
MVLRGPLATREYLQLARSLAQAERGQWSQLGSVAAQHTESPPAPRAARNLVGRSRNPVQARSYGTTSRRPPPYFPEAVWTFSPINTGNPIYDEPVSPSALTPIAEADTVATASLYPGYDPLAPWPSAPWSTSPCNTGNPIFDHFFNNVETSNNTATMTDADYEAFLNKASSDAAAPAPAQTQSTPKAATVNTSQVHPALKSVKATYTSDTDSDFEPVSLSLSEGSGSQLSEEDFAKIAGIGSKDFEVMDVKSFDPHGRFNEVVQAIEQAANVKAADVNVFRAEKSGARCEYWILAVHDTKEERKAVGFKVDAVES